MAALPGGRATNGSFIGALISAGVAIPFPLPSLECGLNHERNAELDGRAGTFDLTIVTFHGSMAHHIDPDEAHDGLTRALGNGRKGGLGRKKDGA